MNRLACPVLACLVTLAGIGCDRPPPGAYMTTPAGGDRYIEGPHALGSVRLRSDLCEGVAENVPSHARLDHESLARFLEHQGFRTRALLARSDLVYLDVMDEKGGESTRLRVAILENEHAAAQDLHRAILEHGPGSWGVHRSNLAVLAPIGSVDQILEFAGRTKLACWGVLTVCARDDDFVVPGGYVEF
jgi:hypothetical protein